METLQAIRTKRAVRQYTDEPVPEATIKAILDAGRLAQSSKNTQPWHFVVVRAPERLAALAECGRYAAHVAEAAFTVVILQNTDWAFDIGQAAAYMQLAAWDLGVSSCLVYFHDTECARKLLEAPEGTGIQMGIAFGYAAASQGKANPAGRRDFDQVVHWERW
jgi:nitroreductase